VRTPRGFFICAAGRSAARGESTQLFYADRNVNANGVLGFCWRVVRKMIRARGAHSQFREDPMYPVLPIELVLGAIQFACYFFTALTVFFGLVLVRP
jgi:hypothetical protein